MLSAYKQNLFEELSFHAVRVKAKQFAIELTTSSTASIGWKQKVEGSEHSYIATFFCPRTLKPRLI